MNRKYFLLLIVLVFPYKIFGQYTELIKKHTATPNSTGIQLGFWELNNKQPYTLELFGKRPTSRVGFDAWKKMETSQGVYDFSSVIDNYARAHNYGETVLGAVNISFSSTITPGKETIPSFYPNVITDATTRQAAKNFLYAYVQAMLTNIGSITLTIDYEIVSNYKLYSPGSQSRAALWAAWYVEAAATARQAASDMGMSANLKLMPIVNGNPFDTDSPISLGVSQNQWLVDVVNASDYLALDTYQSDSIYPNTSAQTTFDIIQFWIDNFAGSKQVLVTENGFNTVTEIYPNITRVDRNYKTTGTEADQAIFYQNLFSQLGAANQPAGIFHNKLRSYNMWCIRDNTAKPVTDEDRYFGLVGIDANNNDYLKPAVPVVQTWYSALESDPFHSPYYIDFNGGTNLTVELLAGTANDTVSYNNGDDFEFLRYTITDLPTATTYNLHINTLDSGNVIIHINNKWLYQAYNTQFTLDVSPYCLPGDTNIIDVYCTSAKFPFKQRVQYLKLIPENPTSAISNTGLASNNNFILNVPYPNPSKNNNIEISFNTFIAGTVVLEVFNAQSTCVAKLLNENLSLPSKRKLLWNIADLPDGLYFIRMTFNNHQQTKKFIVIK